VDILRKGKRVLPKMGSASFWPVMPWTQIVDLGVPRSSRGGGTKLLDPSSCFDA
jgi:hypothetical protein